MKKVKKVSKKAAAVKMYTNWDREALTKALRKSDSIYEAAEKMGLASSGGNAETIKKYVKAFKLPYTIRQGGALAAR